MSGTISKQYRRKEVAERDIPGDFAFPNPIFLQCREQRRKLKGKRKERQRTPCQSQGFVLRIKKQRSEK